MLIARVETVFPVIHDYATTHVKVCTYQTPIFKLNSTYLVFPQISLVEVVPIKTTSEVQTLIESELVLETGEEILKNICVQNHFESSANSEFVRKD